MKDICHLGAGWAGLCILAVDGWMWSGVRLAGLASRHHEADRSWWRGHGTSAPQSAPTLVTAAMTIRLGLAVLALSFMVSRGRDVGCRQPCSLYFTISLNTIISIKDNTVLVLSRFLDFYSLIHECHFNMSVY